jgi:KDO2-lipid IV(A) lauroyltransferase
MQASFIKILLHCLAYFSLPTLHRVATKLGQWMVKHSRWRITQVTAIHIRLCYPDLSESAQAELIENSLIETCKAFCELGPLWLWSVNDTLSLIKRVEGEIYLQSAMQQGKGVILLTPHLGAWELAGLYASVHYPLTALYRPTKLKDLNTFIRQARERGGGRYVPTETSGVKALYQALRHHQMIGILPDQVPNEAGVFVPFFSVPAYTMTLVSRFSQRTGAPVIFTYAQRLPHGQGFHLHFIPAPPMTQSDDLIIAVTALNQGVEKCIQSCPSQYQWSYKRFKRRPPEFPPLY